MRFSPKTLALVPWLVVLSVALIAMTATEGIASTTIQIKAAGMNGCGTNVNRMESGMALGVLDQYEDTSQFDWLILNKKPAIANGLPGDHHILFSIKTPTGATTSAPNGATFSMDFNLSLQSVIGAMGAKQYGVDNAAGKVFTDNTRTTLSAATVRFPTHVYIEASVQGILPTGMISIGAIFPRQLVGSHPKFTMAQFRMFFDGDGDPSTTGDRSLMAKFGTTAPPNPTSSIYATVAVNVEMADFIVNWDSAVPGVFTDMNGHELAIGPPDPADPQLRQVSSAARPTSEGEFSFLLECALSGACTSFTPDTLHFRLRAFSGYGAVNGVPSSTTLPVMTACPPVPPISPDVALQINPTEFPYLVTIETRCVESIAGFCLRTEIIKTCIGGKCFNVPPRKIPGPTCVRCIVGTSALGGLALGGIAVAFLLSRRRR